MTKEERSKETVFPQERFGSFHGYQCHRKVWKDGYCKQHHPDTIVERQRKADERWKNKPRCPTCKKIL